MTGSRRTLMLDAGSSAGHARLVLDGLDAAGVKRPSLVVLTHSHWDHVVGADEVDVPVVAHRRTAEYLVEHANLDWSDEALEQRLAAGEVSQFHVDNVTQELPSPRDVRIRLADVVFDDSLTFQLGDVTVEAKHVPNDHTDDGCVLFVEPDGVLFVGDAVCESPSGSLTTSLAFPLLDRLLEFGAGHVVEGHNETVMSLEEFEQLADTMRRAGMLAERLGSDEGRVLAELGGAADEETRDIVRAFVSGRARDPL